MKSLKVSLIASLILAAFWISVSDLTLVESPKPDPGTVTYGQESEGNQTDRENWLELLHRSAPETDWRALEARTRWERHLRRQEDRQQVRFRSGVEEVLAGGRLTGTWNEMGSNNQAGSVIDVEYDPETDEIWLVSAGGSLFKSPRDGSGWEVVNQDLRFSGGLLKFVQGPEGKRLLALIDRLPHFSDDGGQSWTPATGITLNDRWGTIRNPVVLEDSLETVFLLAKPDYWSPFRLYRSTDRGASYDNLGSAGTNDGAKVRLFATDPGGEEAYLLTTTQRGFSLSAAGPNDPQIRHLNTNPYFDFGDARANMACLPTDSIPLLFAYAGDGDNGYRVFRSANWGTSWDSLGELESRPWDVGLFLSPSKPELMLAGEVHCQVSHDGGRFWARKNNWGAYYNNVEGALHADMMHFAEFMTADSQYFQLISNHGGLSISYDYMQTVQNIGLEGLNVSQYYDVRSDPSFPYVFFAGSQDQGFQLAESFGQEGPLPFDQVISGDYGHIEFSKGGDHMWVVYPGGTVHYYGVPYSGVKQAQWRLESEDESVWIPPLMPDPDPIRNVIYLAGGNFQGGPGSYLIRLEMQLGVIYPSQLPFDFKDQSAGGEISAMAWSPLNTDRWYAATTNGRFFYSEDRGQNWEQSVQFIPSGHYLYGQAIYASHKDPDLVFLGGSGYDNPAVYVSTDGGRNFTDASDGLPPTVVLGLDADEQEAFLFAATEAGPFVFLMDENKWYDMSGLAAPAQTYWSVEYVEELQTVRFGTYGRGVWDFAIREVVSANEPLNRQVQLKVYPNPARDRIRLNLAPLGKETGEVKIMDLRGRTLRSAYFGPGEQPEIGLSGLPAGLYLASWEQAGRVHTAKFMRSAN